MILSRYTDERTCPVADGHANEATTAYSAYFQKSSVATRRPHRASQLRLRHAGPRNPGQRTAPYYSPGRANRTRAGSAPGSPPRATGRCGCPNPVQRVSGDAEEDLAGELSFRGGSGASSRTTSTMSASRTSPSIRIRRAVAEPRDVGFFLAGGKAETVRPPLLPHHATAPQLSGAKNIKKGLPAAANREQLPSCHAADKFLLPSGDKVQDLSAAV